MLSGLRSRERLREPAQHVSADRQIAFDLGISEVTVKFHRGKVMRKMQAASIGELTRIWESLPTPKREACAT
jgi:FixJ family two-component response regulator